VAWLLDHKAGASATQDVDASGAHAAAMPGKAGVGTDGLEEESLTSPESALPSVLGSVAGRQVSLEAAVTGLTTGRSLEAAPACVQSQEDMEMSAAALLVSLSDPQVFTLEGQARFIEMCACNDEELGAMLGVPLLKEEKRKSSTAGPLAGKKRRSLGGWRPAPEVDVESSSGFMEACYAALRPPGLSVTISTRTRGRKAQQSQDPRALARAAPRRSDLVSSGEIARGGAGECAEQGGDGDVGCCAAGLLVSCV